MGKLAELAGARQLKGAVAVTYKDGTSRSFENEAEAEEALSGTDVFHHRGAFYEKGCTPRGYTAPTKAKQKVVAAPVAVAEPEPERAESKPSESKRRRKRSD